MSDAARAAAGGVPPASPAAQDESAPRGAAGSPAPRSGRSGATSGESSDLSGEPPAPSAGGTGARGGTAVDLVPIAALDRAALPAAAVGYIKRGAWNKADVLLVVVREGRWAVKDYRAKPWLVRVTGRLQLRREERAYRALAGLRGVPAFGRRVDADAIAVEYVEGVRLPKFHKYRPLPELATRLAELLDAIHRRGVVHNDIRSRDNILVTPAGTLFLIDFSSALRFGAGAPSRRILMPLFEEAERRALLKWKNAIAPEAMTERERAEHRRFSRLRRLWPFNPKRDLEEKAARGEGRPPGGTDA